MYLVDEIVIQTADVFGRTPAELVGRSRTRPIVEARQAAMWALRHRYPSLSLETIGNAIGGRHYTTVMHALAAVEERAQHNTRYRRQLQYLIDRLVPPSKRARLTTTPLVHEHAAPS